MSRARRAPRSATALVAGALFALLCGSGCWEQVDKHWFDQMKNEPAVQTLAKEPFAPPDGVIPAGGMPERVGPDDPMFAGADVRARRCAT